MIPELGHFALIVALCLALIQATVPLYGAARMNASYMRLARYTSLSQFMFVALSFAALAYSFLINDFSVAYVAQNSNSHLPLIYRFCALWGAHEGSLLLWVFILNIWIALVSIFSKSLPLPFLARVLSVLAFIAIGFYVFLLTTSDPFVRFLPNFPVDGASLNPILQDPGLAIHPPMLYMGYVGFSVAFAFAIAALIGGRLDANWARWSRPWTTIAWCFLTCGIVLGSWWAYRELGWGGFWFWDPVENASFLPWLVGTALIHSLVVTQKRNVFKAWTVLLAVIAFSLSLLGTFLVRSGILISVHAFAVDPARGVYLLRFLLIVVGVSLALYAWRARRIVNTGTFSFWSRETMLFLNNMILFVAMLTVLIGTIYPLVIDALNLGKISVGAPYFNLVFIPLMVPLLFLMGIGPYFHWGKESARPIFRRMLVHFYIVVALSLLLPWAFGAKEHVWVIFGLSFSLWVILNTLNYAFNSSLESFKFRFVSAAKLPMVLAHIGIGVTVIGLVLTTAYSEQKNLVMKIGDKVTLGEYQFQFSNIKKVKGPDFVAYQAAIRVSKDHHSMDVLHPQLREFPVSQTQASKTAINAGVFRDIYVALGNSMGNDAWSVRLYYKPFVRWIWAGGLLMVFGGIFSVFGRRYSKKRRAS